MAGKNTPILAGGSSTVAFHQAALIRDACFGSILTDAVWQTLQQRPAPIAHLDVAHPFPLPQHPIVPLPGDSGAFATSRALEDR
jgi:hypothetical protein